MKTDIVLAGVGGQGILSIATILANAALAENLHIKQAEVHGMSQRGGDVHSMLRLSSDPIASDLICRGTADLVVSLEPMEALRYVPFLSKKGWIVTNTVPFLNIEKYPEMETVMDDLERHGNVVAFDVDTVAKEVASPRTSNMVLLGAASPFIELDADAIERAIATVFGPKGDAIVEMNVKAFRAGRERALAKK